MASVIVIPQAFDLNKRRFPAEKAAAGYCMQRLAARLQGLSWGIVTSESRKNLCQRYGRSIMLSGGMRKLVLLVFLLASSLSASSQDVPPAADGYVSKTVSATEFSVDGVSILCNSKTSFQAAAKGSVPTNVAPWQKGPYLGERLTVYGQLNLAAHLAVANKIVLGEEEPHRVRGFGIITRVLSPPGEHSDRVVVRADGYPILVDRKADAVFKVPLQSIADIGPNVWIAYDGMQGKDGVVRVSRARFIKNTISGGEDRLRRNSEYDPQAAGPNKQKRRWSDVFPGIDPKKIPTYHDATMQSRVDRIGASLIPEYQRSLPDSDPTKIIFRFQLVDRKKWHDACSLPSGIILLPKQVVEKMQNDSQLAAVLADNIASVLVKQQYRSLRKEEAAAAALMAGVVFDPVFVLPMIALSESQTNSVVTPEEEQSGRMSLGLMADANYKIDQAPLAWSLLATKNPNDLPEIPDIEIPFRAKYLYRILGTTWRNGQAPSGSRAEQGAS